jgi:hypothetical protein
MQNSERDAALVKMAAAIIAFDMKRFLSIKALDAGKTNYPEPSIGPKKRGPKKETYLGRDYAMSHALWEVQRYDRKPYRNRKQKNKRESACSIVAKAVRVMSEKGVEAVYRRNLNWFDVFLDRGCWGCSPASEK